MGLKQALRRWFPAAYSEARDLNGPGGNISFVDWAGMWKPATPSCSTGRPTRVHPWRRRSGGAYYDTNSVVFACATNRILLFSEARFQFQQLRAGRPGDLFVRRRWRCSRSRGSVPRRAICWSAPSSTSSCTATRTGPGTGRTCSGWIRLGCRS